MRFTIEYDGRTKGAKVVPGSLEFGSMEEEDAGNELEMEAVMLKGDAMADWFAESFGCVMKGYGHDAEATEIVHKAFARKKAKKDAGFLERADSFVRKVQAELPTLLEKFLHEMENENLGTATEKDMQDSPSSRELLEELASKSGNEALVRYLKMSKDREGGT